MFICYSFFVCLFFAMALCGKVLCIKSQKRDNLPFGGRRRHELQFERSLQCGRPGFDLWVGKIPWRRKGYPLQYSGLENSMDYTEPQRVRCDWVTFTSHTSPSTHSFVLFFPCYWLLVRGKLSWTEMFVLEASRVLVWTRYTEPVREGWVVPAGQRTFLCALSSFLLQ